MKHSVNMMVVDGGRACGTRPLGLRLTIGDLPEKIDIE